MKKKDLFEICSGVVFCFLISSFTALFFDFDVDKLKLFFENASFGSKFLIFFFDFIFPFILSSYFIKFCFWIKNKFKDKNKVVK